MRLFIMRHGPAEAVSKTGRDFDRSLSEHGRECTRAVACELVARGETVSRIFTSPLVRACQTADIVAAALGQSGTPDIRDELSPEEDGHPLVRELVDAGVSSALLIGHAPDVSHLAERLLGTRVSAFEPAMVIAIELASRSPASRFVLRPSELDVLR